MKLINILLEQEGLNPKVVIMAGGAGAGKTYLLNQLQLGSLPLVNPDKYVEDPKHPAYNSLGKGTAQANKDAQDLINKKESFVWDTTASNPKKVQELVDKGYDVYMVMVYTHPMISYISNFQRERNIPASAVFSTWRSVYKLIEEYNEMLKGKLSIFVNLRNGKFDKEVEGFNKAAEQGPQGIKAYLTNYNEKHGAGKSTFFQPVEMSKEEEAAFEDEVKDFDYDRANRSEDKAIKQEFLKYYRRNKVGPGDDKLLAALKKYRAEKESNDQKYEDVLENIAKMLINSTFQEKLKHSSVQDIDSKLQNFLA